MTTPTPIENLPGFNSGLNSQPGSDPWLKFIIVGGVILLGVVISASIMKRAQQNILKIKYQVNENEKD
ncbi:MAG: hypothetical protein O2852_08690 [Bacteroidetes bacterium]|nr:hypothetical protein [Bacteroidota bacterium]MDA0732937.1 hypothetical protein [Bacteroidota bacterium]MDA0981413.1 hypothetical protein [Bacteroidota bacterium]